ncbi:3-carboxy-cis,cis-muconate cycloisomerase [Actinomycetospora sp. NBRC 106375]|uniref:lyase family protein n=1 Tax=Actinomycetospora sp. NBRC 106375 TaxID=3032207 RepID=UPI0024A10122|nr:lyase family protein [Actinomycetospora sp. NBRC 106375]GLZ48621.1 3-carboxy-cis,cis-muconate cycloisomerase [Actinomycetospora sp. NBRC 106375]
MPEHSEVLTSPKGTLLDVTTPGLFDAVLARGGARDATSDRAWVRALLDVEAALAAAAADVGTLDRDDADAIAAACEQAPDPGELGEAAAASGNPVVPLVAQLRQRLEGSAASGVHRGATSQDVQDTAAMLVARDAVGVVVTDLRAAADATAALAAAHRDRPAAGRTLLQQAAPITAGLRAAGWTAGLDAAAEALDAWRPAVQLGGAVGNLAAFDGHGRAVRAALARRLGLVEPVLAWHTERGRVAELAGLLGRAGAATGSVATDLVLLAQTEVGEVREDVPGRGGSSTLPHKRNPVAAVSARAAAIAAPGLVASVLTAASLHEHERAAGPWHAEWRPLTELLRTVGSGASWLADALTHLAVDPERIAASLDVTGGLLLAEQATTGLRGRLGHASAKDLVTTAAATAQDERRPFADVLTEALAGLDDPPDDPAAEVAALLDPAGAIGEAPALVDDLLSSRARKGPS